MSRENVELVRRGLELFNRGEFDTLLRELLHPGIELTPGIGPLLGVGTLRGSEAVRRFWEEELPQGLDQFHAEIQRFEDLGEVVIVQVRYRARGPGSGMDIEQDFATLYAFRDGLIARIHDYPTPEEALKAAGIQD